MVVDALMLMASWHPGEESKYNAFNPGLIMSVGTELERCMPYVCAGAYLDSHEHWASVAGAGIRFGDDTVGFKVTVAHVHGSEVEKYPVVPILSGYYNCGRWGFEVLYPGAIAFGVRYRIWE